jgi:hypothetical protein
MKIEHKMRILCLKNKRMKKSPCKKRKGNAVGKTKSNHKPAETSRFSKAILETQEPCETRIQRETEELLSLEMSLELPKIGSAWNIYRHALKFLEYL